MSVTPVNVSYTHYFYYISGKKHARIQYCERKIPDTKRILIFRDVDENEKCRYNYQRCIDQGKRGYTPEKLEANKEFFGVYVFQTNSTKSPKEVFEAYKKRWGSKLYVSCYQLKGDTISFLRSCIVPDEFPETIFLQWVDDYENIRQTFTINKQ